MVENAIQIKILITINADASGKNVYVNKTLFGFDIILFVYRLCCPTCSCKDGFIDDSVITYDEVIEETKTIPKKLK